VNALEYRVKRYGRVWRAFLKRSDPRPLFYEGANKREAIGALLNGVAKMARDQPGRLWPKIATPPVSPVGN
jgi:hypothetical protein